MPGDVTSGAGPGQAPAAAVDTGGGLVLLHGFTGTPAAWDPVLAAAPPTLDPARVLRPPLLGHGAPAPGAARFDDEVDRLAALVAGAAALDRPHLAGYSLGGRVALGLLARHPGAFRGATLIGAHPGLDDPAERAARVAGDEAWAARLEEDGLAAFVDAWEAQPLFASQASLPAPLREAQRRARLSHDPAALARSLRVLGLGAMPTRWSALRTIEVPVRLLVGASDPRFRALAARAATVLPRAQVQVIDGAGHNVVLERPEAFWHAPDPTS